MNNTDLSSPRHRVVSLLNSDLNYQRNVGIDPSLQTGNNMINHTRDCMLDSDKPTKLVVGSIVSILGLRWFIARGSTPKEKRRSSCVLSYLDELEGHSVDRSKRIEAVVAIGPRLVLCANIRFECNRTVCSCVDSKAHRIMRRHRTPHPLDRLSRLTRPWNAKPMTFLRSHARVSHNSKAAAQTPDMVQANTFPHGWTVPPSTKEQ